MHSAPGRVGKVEGGDEGKGIVEGEGEDIGEDFGVVGDNFIGVLLGKVSVRAAQLMSGLFFVSQESPKTI